MRQVILMRHGKAADHWEDWARPLSTKGKEEVKTVTSRLLNDKTVWPQYVICSEAERTQQTFKIFSDIYAHPQLKAVYVQTLYHGNIRKVLQTIGEVPDEVENLLVIGHNPVLSELACLLSQDQVALSTANAVVLLAQEEKKGWAHIDSDSWKLKTFLTPD